MTGGPLILLHGFLGRPAAWDRVLAHLDGIGASSPCQIRQDGIEPEKRSLAKRLLFTRSAGSTVGPAIGRADSWTGIEVHAPSLPGHGPDPSPVGERFVDVVESVHVALPAGRCWLAGYSMGARVALALAVLHPERVRGAVLIGPDVGLRDEGARATRRAWDLAQAEKLEIDGVDRFAAAWENLPLFDSQKALPDEHLAEQARQRRDHTAAGLASAMRVLGTGSMPSFWEDLAACPVELRFLAGILDAKFTAVGREAVRVAPRATFRAVDGAGHNLLLERPEAVAEEIRDMIAREYR